MPPRVRLRRQALADLRDIGRYTRQHWGRERRNRYLGALDACMDSLP